MGSARSTIAARRGTLTLKVTSAELDRDGLIFEQGRPTTWRSLITVVRQEQVTMAVAGD